MWQQALLIASVAILSLLLRPAGAQDTPAAPAPQYVGALTTTLGGDEQGLRAYVLVVLNTGPNKVAVGPARKKMFEGHFANIQRLAAEKSWSLPARSMAPRSGAACSCSPRPTSTKPRHSLPPTRSS